MPKIRDVLVHVSIETASRKRKCHRNQAHSVSAGDVCLVIKDGLASKNYCRVCAAEILMHAQTRIADIQRSLTNSVKE